ncbi:XRE family transcriptional regulator [Microbacterium plantarum]|uniref:XRE family transcriptional regulator n=1 Tax=Microbacterium plantarum TaxID=1816425 RepID=UPI002B487AC2|nr:XRE family transcriptional regulator [Microbacterium plantarum]WRK17116.1 XRE family transcriptional regulator [Microbacterium plantarum]
MKLVSDSGGRADPAAVARAFDPERLRQARQLALRTKQDVAHAVGVSAAAIGQFESGVTPPRADTVDKLAAFLKVPVAFFTAGRPRAQLESGSVFFRSLRSTTAKQRSKSVSYTEQVWELANALERHVRFPNIDIPGFSGGEVAPGSFSADPAAAAQQLRHAWRLGDGPISQMVRLAETKGIVAVLVPMVEDEVAKIDAFSTVALNRPILVLSPDRADDVYRHRFSAAHELGHIILHGGRTAGTVDIEREADKFAAEFLTPARVMESRLRTRLDMADVLAVSREWGIEPRSVVYRSRELGKISEATARRGYIRLNQMNIPHEPVARFPGELPSLLSKAVELAEQRGVTIPELARELAWSPAHVRRMLGAQDDRPHLTLAE